jgi:hypothetical protein
MPVVSIRWLEDLKTRLAQLSERAGRTKPYTRQEMEKLVPLAGNAKEAVDLWGAMRGTVRVAPGVDLTEPMGEIWDAEL